MPGSSAARFAFPCISISSRQARSRASCLSRQAQATVFWTAHAGFAEIRTMATPTQDELFRFHGMPLEHFERSFASFRAMQLRTKGLTDAETATALGTNKRTAQRPRQRRSCCKTEKWEIRLKKVWGLVRLGLPFGTKGRFFFSDSTCLSNSDILSTVTLPSCSTERTSP